MKLRDIEDFETDTLYTDGETIIRTIKDFDKLTYNSFRNIPHIRAIPIMSKCDDYVIGREQNFAIELDEFPDGRWEKL